jgi:protein pelota
MKLLEKKLDKDAKGHVKLVPENADDLWQLYNIAAAGDAASGVTLRKISKENAAGGKDTERIKMRLTLDVESVEFDQEAEELRIKGRNTTENEHIRQGAYHTLELTPGRALSIRKDNWDAVHLEVIEVACNPAASADLAVVLVTEGLANVILVGGSCTLVRAKVEKSMPRKRGAAMAGYEKALNTFLENALQVSGGLTRPHGISLPIFSDRTP